MTDNDMQQFQFDKIGKKTPYNVPEGFFRDLESTLIRTIPEKAVETSQEVRTAPSRSLWLWAMKTTLSAAAVVVEHYGIVTARQRTRTPIVGTGIQQSERNRPGIYNRHIPE